MARIPIETITKWLSDAPKIARDTAPFYWTFLDAPPIGKCFLTWQPLARLGTELASDGYIWAGAEQFQQMEVGGGMVCLYSFFQGL